MFTDGGLVVPPDTDFTALGTLQATATLSSTLRHGPDEKTVLGTGYPQLPRASYFVIG